MTAAPQSGQSSTHAHRIALAYPCLLAEETAHERYAAQHEFGTVVLSVNAGYE